MTQAAENETVEAQGAFRSKPSCPLSRGRVDAAELAAAATRSSSSHGDQSSCCCFCFAQKKRTGNADLPREAVRKGEELAERHAGRSTRSDSSSSAACGCCKCIPCCSSSNRADTISRSQEKSAAGASRSRLGPSQKPHQHQDNNSSSAESSNSNSADNSNSSSADSSNDSADSSIDSADSSTSANTSSGSHRSHRLEVTYLEPGSRTFLLVLLLQLCVVLSLTPAAISFRMQLICCASVAAFVAADRLMPLFAKKLLECGFAGRDLHKPPPSPLVPEAGGLCCIFCFLAAATAGQLLLDRRHLQLVEYPAALLGATWMGFLGFVDDALALPWRLKLLLPLLAASPIVAAYSGSTTVVLPCRVYTLLRDAWTGVAVTAAPAAANVAAAVELPIKHLVGALLLLMQQLCQWELQLRQIHSKLLSSIPAAAAAAAASAARCALLGLQQLSDLLFGEIYLSIIISHNILRLLPSEPKLLTSSSSGSCSSGFWVLVDVRELYYVYMTLLTIFCTNAINIYAGINGLEVGQSVVIASFVCIHNVVELSSHFGSVDAAKVVLAQQHFFSLVLCLPFLATSLALLKHNWYPSRVFVGDTYTCFAGVVLAAAGILGHFSKTLLLFFIPQFLNFLISLPQLLGFVPCPRHRTPKYIPELGLLVPSPNFTLINLVLWVFGPMTEQRLLCILLLLQAACCALGLLLRYHICTFLLFA